jgi:glutaredoxin-like protein NrdH
MVTVYSLPSCPQCDTTKRFLEKKNIEYTEIDLTQDPDALDKIKDWGYSAAPVVHVNGTHWSGFRFEMLNKIAA